METTVQFTLKQSLFALAMLGMAGTSLAVEPLSVAGNKILAGGQVASFAGNSLFWSNNGWGGEKYYNADVVNWLKRDWKSNLVRVAMGVEESGAYLQDPAGNKAKVRAVVDAAIANDMYVIIDWHTHHAEQYRDQAIAFFQDMARTYGNHPNVIYEIYNEPLQVSWSGTIKPYAEAVAGAIRSIDPDNLIIVGTPVWSQNVDDAARDPITRFKNIAYTLHFYAGSHGQGLRDRAQAALNNNAALFVTEWGSVGASGDGAANYGETSAWIDFLKRNQISHANWALNDKAEGASALVAGAHPNGGWASNQLTASGTLARDIIRNWSGSTPPPATCSTVVVPGVVQAEGYCQMSGVQLESTSDAGGGQNVGYIDAGDWMSYSVDVKTAGTYKISYRVASAVGGGLIQLEQAGGGSVFGTLAVPNTGGWQNWQTISHTVTLAAGKQSIGLLAKSGGFNLNWIQIESAGAPVGAITIQGENYLVMSGVQLETTSDVGGGQNVGYIDSGDWMSYPAVTIPASGLYTVEYRVASLSGGGSLQLEQAGGSPVYGSIGIPATGGWQNWVTVKHTVNLAAGSHKFGIKANGGGWNLNWFRLSKVN